VQTVKNIANIRRTSDVGSDIPLSNNEIIPSAIIIIVIDIPATINKVFRKSFSRLIRTRHPSGLNIIQLIYRSESY